MTSIGASATCPNRPGGSGRPGVSRATCATMLRPSGWMKGKGGSTRAPLSKNSCASTVGGATHAQSSSSGQCAGNFSRRLTVSTAPLPQTPGNVDVKCLKCNRARGSEKSYSMHVCRTVLVWCGSMSSIPAWCDVSFLFFYCSADAGGPGFV